MAPEAVTQETPLLERYPLSTEARKLLELSRVEVVELKHEQVGTEHILLACLKDTEIASFLNVQLGTEAAMKIESATKFIVADKRDAQSPADIGFTQGTEKVLSWADKQRQKEHAVEVTKFHLLIGLVRQGEGIAASVLESLGLNFEKLMNGYHEALLAAYKDQISGVLSDLSVSTQDKYGLLAKVRELADESREMRSKLEPQPFRPQSNVVH